jgi:antitoxin HigA-1
MPPQLNGILTKRAPVTPEMARRLGRICGTGPELWRALQSSYDLDRLGKAKHDQIAAMPTLAAE